MTLFFFLRQTKGASRTDARGGVQTGEPGRRERGGRGKREISSHSDGKKKFSPIAPCSRKKKEAIQTQRRRVGEEIAERRGGKEKGSGRKEMTEDLSNFDREREGGGDRGRNGDKFLYHFLLPSFRMQWSPPPLPLSRG